MSTPGTIRAANQQTDRERKRAWFLQAYNTLSDNRTLVPGSGIVAVRIEDIRRYMVQHGFLATEDGKVPGRERMAFARAREDLIRDGHFACDEENFWEVHPS